MIRLIYASIAAPCCDTAQLVEILNKSRGKNERAGLTGILLHSNGSFLQVLEGRRAIVDALYEKILLDKRHEKITLILREAMGRRYFGSWSMGFSDLTHEMQTDQVAGLDLGVPEGAFYARVGGSDTSKSTVVIAGMNDLFENGRLFTEIDVDGAKRLFGAFAKGRWKAKITIPTVSAATSG